MLGRCSFGGLRYLSDPLTTVAAGPEKTPLLATVFDLLFPRFADLLPRLVSELCNAL